MIPSSRLRPLSVIGAVVTLWTLSTGAAPPPPEQALPANTDRLAEMRHHYGEALLIHEAVIRGDLQAVKAPAQELAQAALPPGVPASASVYVGGLRAAARRAIAATTLNGAARASVEMVGECANCHAALSIYPSPPTTRSPEVGGLVGHMLEHRRAADDMLQSLLTSSTSTWQAAAERLRAAPLLASDLPPDPRLTADLRKAEIRVHQLADQAAKETSQRGRSETYVQLISTCAECHSLHRRVWGPGTGN